MALKKIKKTTYICRHAIKKQSARSLAVAALLLPLSVVAQQPELTFEASPDLRANMACLIEPFQQSDIGSPAPGVISKIHVARGDTIKKGDVLASLDKTVDEATLRLRNAEAAYTNRVVSRNKNLYERKLLPASDYDEMNSRAKVASLQVQLQQALLKERDIPSPYDGVVVERYVGPGDRINDNKILKIAQINPLLVRVVVPEDRYGEIAKGDSAQLRVNQAISTEPLQATVWRIDKVMDAASGTFVVLLSLPNENHAIPAGLRCTVQF